MVRKRIVFPEDIDLKILIQEVQNDFEKFKSMIQAHGTKTAPEPEVRPEVAPAEPITTPTPIPDTPFSPSIQPDTTPKG